MKLLSALYDAQTEMLEQLSKVRLKFDNDHVKLMSDDNETAEKLHKAIKSWLNVQGDIERLRMHPSERIAEKMRRKRKEDDKSS